MQIHRASLERVLRSPSSSTVLHLILKVNSTVPHTPNFKCYAVLEALTASYIRRASYQ